MYVKVILLACQNPSIYRKSDLIYNSKPGAICFMQFSIFANK
jgi:hypothetical protein